MSQQKTCFFSSTRMRLTFFIARAQKEEERRKRKRDREGKKERRGKLRVVVVSLAGKRKKSLEEWGSFSFVLPGVCLFFNAL